MTTHQINLIKTSWKMASENPLIAGSLFYSRLFKVAPEIEPLFSNVTEAQQAIKLTTTLSYVISRLDRLDTVAADVAKLARKHVDYGVKEHHYVLVGEVLIWTLEKALADDWNPEL